MTAGFNMTRFGALLSAALLIAACGGDSGSDSDGDGNNNSGSTYDGATSAAQIDSQEKAEDLARAAGESSRQTKGQESAPTITGVDVEDSGTRDLIRKTTLEVIEQAQGNNSPSAVEFEVSDDCGQGNAVFDVDNDDINSNGGFEEGSLTYNNYCGGTQQNGATINGTVTFNFSYNNAQPPQLTKTEYDYNDVEVTDNATEVTRNIDMTMVCDYNSGTLASCTFSEAFVGANGVTYRVDNAQLAGSAGSYNLTARVFHPNHGYVDVTTNTSLAFNCSSGFPSAGEVSFSDGNGNSVTVTFDDCSQLSWTYNVSGGGTTTGTVTY